MALLKEKSESNVKVVEVLEPEPTTPNTVEYKNEREEVSDFETFES